MAADLQAGADRYTEGLDHEKTNIALNGNAAMASIKMGCYVQAIEHADKVGSTPRSPALAGSPAGGRYARMLVLYCLPLTAASRLRGSGEGLQGLIETDGVPLQGQPRKSR